MSSPATASPQSSHRVSRTISTAGVCTASSNSPQVMQNISSVSAWLPQLVQIAKTEAVVTYTLAAGNGPVILNRLAVCGSNISSSATGAGSGAGTEVNSLVLLLITSEAIGLVPSDTDSMARLVNSIASSFI